MHEGVYCCQATGVTFLKGFILNTNRYDNQFHRKNVIFCSRETAKKWLAADIQDLFQKSETEEICWQ